VLDLVTDTPFDMVSPSRLRLSVRPALDHKPVTANCGAGRGRFHLDVVATAVSGG
jgi:hypothetical protein